MKPFNRIATFLYDAGKKRKIRLFGNLQVKTDLERLHTGGEREKLHRDYYVGKLEKSLVILAVGCVLAVFLAVRAQMQRAGELENALKRGGYADSAKEIEVETVLDGSRERFWIRVEPRALGEDEAQELYEQFVQELPELIVGKNISLQEVRTELWLQESFDGYPFWMEWKSSDTDSVSSSGIVKVSSEEKEVLLTASITYGELFWENELEVRILPQVLTPREQSYRALEEQLILSESDNREEEYWILPQDWEGRDLKWKKVGKNYTLPLLAGAVLLSVAVYFLSDRDLHDELEKKRAQMKREYPDIVHKLALYLGAGMTLRGTFQKIADEYQQSRENGRPLSPAYEEILYMCRELKSGVSEGAAYEHFGRRTGLQEYIRLVTLLSQNLKKGNSTLLPRLHEEADRACAERIQNSRKLGEEASTKLLVPMVMMLGVVMVMIMLPAFGSVGM